MTNEIEPLEVALLIDNYVDRAHDMASKYVNSELLDSSGVFDLHKVAAKVYALGYRDGQATAEARDRSRLNRLRDTTPDAVKTLKAEIAARLAAYVEHGEPSRVIDEIEDLVKP